MLGQPVDLIYISLWTNYNRKYTNLQIAAALFTFHYELIITECRAVVISYV